MPDARGPFDKMVLEQFEMGLNNKIAELKATVEADSPNSAQRAAAAASAQADFDDASSAQHKADGELSAAQFEQKEAEKALKDARDAVAQYEPSYAKATAVRDQKKDILTQFETYNLECFSMLKSKESKKPEAKCVEVPAKATLELPAKASLDVLIDDFAKDAEV